MKKMARSTKTVLLTAIICFLSLQNGEAHAQLYNGRWYKGDLHTHSLHSDGDSSVARVLQSAAEKGLDFFAITDHDTNMMGRTPHWLDPDYHSESIILLYGVEWTTGPGHANVWSSTPFSYDGLWQANLQEDSYGAVLAAHDQLAIFSINHPGAFFCCPWEYPVYDEIDTIEVWNAMFELPNFSSWSVRQFWESLLQGGRRIPVVGGSDTHHVDDWQSLLFGHGNPTTWIFAEEPSAQSLLEAIKTGHVSISCAPDAVRLDFSADTDSDDVYETMMGDNVALPSGQAVSFKVEISGFSGRTRYDESVMLNTQLLGGLEANETNKEALLDFVTRESSDLGNDIYVACIYKNGSLYKLWLLFPGAPSFIFSDTPSSSGRTYYRVELLGKPRVPLALAEVLYGSQIALTNPIYFGFPRQ